MKYPIHKDFWMLKYLRMPKNIWLIRLWNQIGKFLYWIQSVKRNVKRTRIQIPTRDHHFIKADIIRPRHQTKKLPTMVYYPGGGFMMNAIHVHKRNASDIALKMNMNIVLVHYRLAPKYTFPTALFDAIDACLFLYQHASIYEFDPDHFTLGGDSAGGNLAASVSLYLKEQNHHFIKAQMLIYPALDSGIMNDSRKRFSDTPMFDSKMFSIVGKYYYKNGLFGLDQLAFPLYYPDLTGLCPTYIETTEFDPLHDDGALFAKKLDTFQVPYHYRDTHGTVHGYDAIKKSEIVKESMKQRIAFLTKYM